MSTETIFSLVFLALQILFLVGTWGIAKCLEKYLPFLREIRDELRKQNKP